MNKQALYRFRAVLLFLSFSLQVSATPWQLVLQTINRSDTKVLSANIINAGGKIVSHPGLSSSVETHDATISWIRDGNVYFTARAEVPFGNRFDNRCNYYRESCQSALDGISVVRVEGPRSKRDGDSIRVDFEGATKRLGAAIYDPTPRKAAQRVISASSVSPVTALDGAIGSRKIHSTGSNSNRYVIVVVGDGYRSQDISSGTYSSNVQKIVTYLKSQSPWDKLIKVTNIYMVNVVSNQAGADDPCVDGGSCTIKNVNTYFDSSFGTSNIDRLLAPSYAGISRAITVADEAVGSGVWDSIIMVVNSSKYGGSGGYISVTSTHSSAPDIAVHEMGHSIGDLADEYESAYPGYPETITEPNVDSRGSRPKWKAWVTAGVPLPTSETSQYSSSVGAFEGARYKSSGVYRPMQSCKMRYLGVPFCPVCKEALFEGVLSKIKLYDAVSPTTSKTVKLSKTPKRFSITPIKAGTVTTSWSLCGKKLTTTSSSLSLIRSQMRYATCNLSATIRFTTALIRQKRHTKTITWKLSK